MKKKTPIEGDDAGNLIKAGYAPTEIKLAETHYNQALKTMPEDMANTTFSDFLFQNAYLNVILDEKLKK